MIDKSENYIFQIFCVFKSPVISYNNLKIIIYLRTNIIKNTKPLTTQDGTPFPAQSSLYQLDNYKNVL